MPSHELFSSLWNKVKNGVEVELPGAMKYLRGEEIPCDEKAGASFCIKAFRSAAEKRRTACLKIIIPRACVTYKKSEKRAYLFYEKQD